MSRITLPEIPLATIAPPKKTTDPRGRLLLLHWVLAAAMLCGFLMSTNLWLSSRTYPLAPVWEGLPAIPYPGDWLWFGLLLVLVVAPLAMPRPAPFIFLFVVLAGLLAVWDQTRWQPWFYQYLFMFAVLGFAWRRPDDAERQEAGLNACRLIVASIYIWSGLQKVNVSFATDVHPYLMAPVLKLLPDAWHGWVNAAGWYVPFVETGIGLSLLVWPLCYPAV